MKKYVKNVSYSFLLAGLVFVSGFSTAHASTLSEMQNQVSDILTQVQQLPGNTMELLQLKVSLLTGALSLQQKVNALIQQSLQTQPTSTTSNILTGALSALTLPVGCTASAPTWGDVTGSMVTWNVNCGHQDNNDARTTFGRILPAQGWRFCDAGLGSAHWYKGDVMLYIKGDLSLGHGVGQDRDADLVAQCSQSASQIQTTNTNQPKPSVSILSPVAGQTYHNGEKSVITNIQWTTQNFGGMKVSIVLYGKAVHKVLANEIANTGIFAWAADTSLASGPYTIRVMGVVPGSEKGPYGEATVSFNLNTFIPQPTISVISPTAGMVLSNGEKDVITNIRWETTNFGNMGVTIVLDGVNNGIHKTLAIDAINTGTFLWLSDTTIPDGAYQLRLLGTIPGSEKGPFGIATSGYFTLQ